jgi:hypothetical protein
MNASHLSSSISHTQIRFVLCGHTIFASGVSGHSGKADLRNSGFPIDRFLIDFNGRYPALHTSSRGGYMM